MSPQKDSINLELWPDLEGINRMDDTTQVFPASPQYQIYMTEETNAAIRDFKKGAVEEYGRSL